MRSHSILIGVLLGVSACSAAVTSDTAADVETMRARWTARRAYSYDYVFDQGGFFNACPRPVRAYVHANGVDSARVLATGQLVSNNLVPCVPTIDGLFEAAVAAARSGKLTSIQYDATQGYPSEIVISGPPDASGWLRASSLANVLVAP